MDYNHTKHPPPKHTGWTPRSLASGSRGWRPGSGSTTSPGWRTSPARTAWPRTSARCGGDSPYVNRDLSVRSICINSVTFTFLSQREYGFYPKTWVLPHDAKDFCAQFDADGRALAKGVTYILKPENSSKVGAVELVDEKTPSLRIPPFAPTGPRHLPDQEPGQGGAGGAAGGAGLRQPASPPGRLQVRHPHVCARHELQPAAGLQGEGGPPICRRRRLVAGRLHPSL